MKKAMSIFVVMVMVLSVLGMMPASVSAAAVTAAYDEVYTELYRMDFDAIDTITAGTDEAAFNAVYGDRAELLSNKSNFNYTIAPKSAGSADKYLQMDSNFADGASGVSALQINFPDGTFKANNGTYKISYDVKTISTGNKPFLRIKTNHMTKAEIEADTAIVNNGGIYNWGPMLGGIAPINDAGTRDQSAANVYGTYSTYEGTENVGWFTASWNNDDKVVLARDVWHKADIKIDTVNLKAYYYYDGKYIGCQQGEAFRASLICGETSAIKNIQFQAEQGHQVENGYQLDNIIISHSDSEVANPAMLPAGQTLYKEVYRLDFDELENRAVDEAGAGADPSGFNTAYSGVASIGGNNTTYTYAISPKEDNSSDKYLMLTNTVLTANDNSKIVTLRLTTAADERPAANSGIYKISYDMRINAGSGQKPFMQLKTYHYNETNYESNWGPCLSAIGPISDSDGVSWDADATVYGTYSAHAGYGESVNMETGSWFPKLIGDKYALSLGEWHNVEILLDTDSGKADYYYDGVYTGTQRDATFAKNYLFGTNIMQNMQFQVFQGYQAKGFQIDNLTLAKEVTSATMKAEGFEGISAIDLSEDSKKLTFASYSNIGEITNAVVVDGSNGLKVANTVSATANEATLSFDTALSANGLYTIYLIGGDAVVTGKLTLGTGVETEVPEQGTGFELLSVEAADDNGEAIEVGDTVSAKAIMRNVTGTEQTAYLIIAIYNDGILAQIDYKPIASEELVFEDTISLSVENAENIEVSAFVWKSMTTIEPLGASDSI